MVKIRRASQYFARLMRPRKLKKNDHQSIRPSRAPSMAKLATSARALKANTEADYRDTSRFLRWTSARAGGGGYSRDRGLTGDYPSPASWNARGHRESR